MKLAIHYSTVKQPPKPGQIYGLQVAISDWIRAAFSYSNQERFFFFIHQEESIAELEETAQEAGISSARLVFLSDRFPRQNMEAFDTIFRADPDPRHLLWQRNLLPSSGFSFCGLAHAIAGKDSGAVLARYCLGPSKKSDALVCPSESIKRVVQNFFAHYGDYLTERFGANYTCPIQLPVIPLGVNIEQIEKKVSPEKRKAQRQTLGLDEKDVVVLWVGRLSYSIKAHPLPMFLAVQEAAQKTGRSVHFIMQGYFVPETAAQKFENLAKSVCLNAKVSFIDTHDKRFPDGLWAAGDIFLSLVDNIQESFGLTPIEAIAAGLPRVLSDWDGYRESVTHGKDGFLVPTSQPPSGAGGELAELMIGGRESYGGILAKTAQCIAIDHHAAGRAIAELIEKPELRLQIANEAKKRLPTYAWENIIPAYENLWEELAKKKTTEQKLPFVHPHAPDPFTLYDSHPSLTLKEETRFTLDADTQTIQNRLSHEMNTLALDIMINAADIPILLNKMGEQDSFSYETLVQTFPDQDRNRLWRTVSWLLKLGIIRICSHN
ncbi:MAG TPA: hypothetical protein DD400_02730 [Rhodospirillaceae bacterium]|nr:hypothetical protein [Rhodospirillaceae bacterium]